MIEHLRHMAIFARVVDEGSFRAAAKSLGVAPSRVSETVSDLEGYLGLTLLYRTTRRLSLTHEGRLFYAHVTEMLHNAEAGLNELNALSLEPAGALRLSVPAFLASSEISTALADFLRRHPNVALTINHTDYPVNQVEQGFDLTIRAGWLDDSAMMARKLGESGRVLVAGAGYAASRARPSHPAELEDWDWLRYRHRSDVTELHSKAGQSVRVEGKSQVELDSIEALYHFTRQDLGVTILPRHLVDRGLADGAFVQILPDWALRPLGIYAVWPDKSRRETLTVLLVRHLADQLSRGITPDR